MSKVNIDLDYLRTLHEHALRIGTVENWSKLALQWAESANAEIHRIQENADRLETALRDLLDFARRRIATGDIPPAGQRAIDLLAELDLERKHEMP